VSPTASCTSASSSRPRASQYRSPNRWLRVSDRS
jgi:hypothetical protein